MRNVVTLVLGGGRGTRLLPLTQYRSKPAVPLAGKYRLIDIPLSNCINSGLNRIYVLTQFMSVSLHRHIRQAYRFDAYSQGFVEILAAQQTMEKTTDWYEGTADAVRKNVRYLEQPGIDYVLILSGDQLYRMNFLQMLETHQAANADATIATIPVDRDQARQLGIMRIDDSGRVRGFVEKPTTDEELAPVIMDPTWIEARNIESRGRECLASMGIYLFNRDVLVDVLKTSSYQDFGREVFPSLITPKRVAVHLFDGYWEDIGTTRAFYEANLALASQQPPFDLVSAEAPIYSRARFLPPTCLDGATIKHSLIADGCRVSSGTTIENSVIGLRCTIGENVTIKNSIIMGVDEYETRSELREDLRHDRPNIGIGSGSTIINAIVDKNVRIGEGAHIEAPTSILPSEFIDRSDCAVRDGIIVVKKEAILADGWRWQP
ncbi:MAG: glucose-1-phosphate adenylyltransferase [Planctomycetaceae bacterium]|nr:glucose-1-phosphate adenylyltransferase [Planctomycetaceae bacterium]